MDLKLSDGRCDERWHPRSGRYFSTFNLSQYLDEIRSGQDGCAWIFTFLLTANHFQVKIDFSWINNSGTLSCHRLLHLSLLSPIQPGSIFWYMQSKCRRVGTEAELCKQSAFLACKQPLPSYLEPSLLFLKFGFAAPQHPLKSTCLAD